MKFSMKLLAQITLGIFAILFIVFGSYLIWGFYEGLGSKLEGTGEITDIIAILLVSFMFVFLLILGIYFILVGIFELITILVLAKTKKRDVILVLGILITIFGGVLPGVFMLLIKEEDPVQNTDLTR